MTCNECTDLLLEADPGELRGEVRGPLTSHLQACDLCHLRARRILQEYERVDRALTAIEQAHRSHRRNAPRRLRMASLLAAATFAGVFIAERVGDDDSPPLDPGVIYAALHPPRPLVETEGDTRAAIVRTDRRLTLVVLYQGDR